MSYDDPGGGEGAAPRRDRQPPQLRTRQPTGAVAYPVILVEGEEKAGKKYAALSLSRSPRVGRTFVVSLGEQQVVDEYASLGPYEIVDHNGTFGDFADQLQAACDQPMEPDKPNVVIVASGTALWALLSRWAYQRARSSRKNREKLASDPDAEIDVTTNYWNDAKARWRRVYDALDAFPGIGIITARGKEVTEFREGQPIPNKFVWSVEAEKTLTWDADLWVRCYRRPRKRQLIAVRSLVVDVGADDPIDLPLENTLEHLVFDLIGSGAPFAATTSPATPVVGVPSGRAKTRLLEWLQHHGVADEQRRIELASKAWAAADLEGMSEVTEAQLRVAIETLGAEVPTDEGVDPAAVDYVSQGKDDLANALRHRHLPTSGTKDDMVARLVQSDRESLPPVCVVCEQPAGGDKGDLHADDAGVLRHGPCEPAPEPEIETPSGGAGVKPEALTGKGYMNWPNVQLAEEIKERNAAGGGVVATKGNKAALVERLRENDAERKAKGEIAEDYVEPDERPF